MRRIVTRPYEQYLDGLSGYNRWWCSLCPTDIGQYPSQIHIRHFIDAHNCEVDVPWAFTGPVYYRVRVLRPSKPPSKPYNL